MKSFCSYYNQNICRSCSLIELPYREQIRLKEQKLKMALKSFEGFDLLPTVLSQEQGMRNKAKVSVTGTLENPVIGLIGQSELDQGREIISCSLHHPELNFVLAQIPDFIRLANLKPYQIKEKKGELKGLILYFSETSSEAYLRFVLRSKEALDRLRKHLSYLQEKLPTLVCVSANIQPVAHALLEGEEEIILTKQSTIEHLGLHIGPKGFVQTNQQMARRLYETAAEWCRLLNVERFLELYCGQGAFSFFLAPFVKEARGFEINAEAVARANETARSKGLTNITFSCADAAIVGAEVLAFSPDLLLVNPPRRGLGSDGVKVLKEANVPYLIYSSCSVESLEKDLLELARYYRVERVQIFDMFPHTEHFETLVLLKLISS